MATTQFIGKAQNSTPRYSTNSLRQIDMRYYVIVTTRHAKFYHGRFRSLCMLLKCV